jgi:hypothetical protein
MALTFTGDPAADNWTFVGNSSSPSYYVRGTTSFNIYKTTFLLGPTDIVSSSSFPQSDAYLYNGAGDSWKIGDRILGFGISGWSGLQEGGWPTETGSSGISYLKFDPAGTGVFGNASSGKPDNDTSIYQSPGSLASTSTAAPKTPLGRTLPPTSPINLLSFKQSRHADRQPPAALPRIPSAILPLAATTAQPHQKMQRLSL